MHAQSSLAGEVLAKARVVLQQEDERRERELFERLRRELARGGRAVAGLERTLEAVNESRVETLLAREGLVAPGVFCPRCGVMGTPCEGEASPAGGRRCPIDGGGLGRTGSG